jgi:DNA-binding NtrC family response regulator
VLCVDDNPEILRLLKRQLGERYDLSIAQTANEALGFMKTGAPYDVIISDLRMPDVHGLAFLKQARELAPSSERIILTGQADPTTMSVARAAAGAAVLINKPWAKDELIEAVDDAVQRRRTKAAVR